MSRREAAAATAAWLAICAGVAYCAERWPKATLATVSVAVVYQAFRQAGPADDAV